MQLRVDAPAGMDLFLAVRHPDRCPALIVEVAKESIPRGWRVPDVRGLHALHGPGQYRSARIAVIATKASFWEPFGVVADDLISHVNGAETPAAALAVIARRLEMWARFFDKAPSGRLARSERLGLLGELYLLAQHLLPASGGRALLGWKGPEGGPHDFVIGSVGVEAKCTTAQEPVQLEITSARQLDGQALDKLFLYGLCLVEGPAGELTLAGQVSSLRLMIKQHHPEAGVRLEDLLLQAGYSDDHAAFYGEDHYSVKQDGFFRVVSGFPRILESDLQAGIGNVRYTVDWSACRPFVIPPSTALLGL
ncbi:MAG: PD-(D/E)XK motif protein [Gemmatimonadetes bacterium]|nr:PD-(D/E)XK motif protein [Gemmatimonadota bacterium]MBK7925495.1 PD-(D/E)XK motif protein [Gemmatimonadota bacterium]